MTTFWTFDAAFLKVVGIEKGYVNDKQDAGGATKYGISQRAYPKLDIANLTLDAAKAIYLTDYWTKGCCESVPNYLALLMFDAAVLHGLGASAQILQDSVNVPSDRIIGPATLRAAAYAMPLTLINEYAARRALYIARLAPEKIEHDGLGWMRRAATMHAASLTVVLSQQSIGATS